MSLVWNRVSALQVVQGFLADDSDRLPLVALWAFRVARWSLRRAR